MTNAPNIIQSLWIGTELSIMERLSMESFIYHGNPYHLYAYNDIKGIPDGVKIFDANSIMPEEEVFCYQTAAGKGSFSAFSNFFRYKLLYEEGGFWSDTDNICLKPFTFTEDYVFGMEMSSIQGDYAHSAHIASGLFKTPTGCKAMMDNYEYCLTKDRSLLRWGEVGPKLVSRCVEKFNLGKYVKPHTFFNPIGYGEIVNFVSASPTRAVDLKNSFSVHLWNECWRREGLDKNKTYDPDSVYEGLKAMYLK